MQKVMSYKEIEILNSVDDDFLYDNVMNLIPNYNTLRLDFKHINYIDSKAKTYEEFMNWLHDTDDGSIYQYVHMTAFDLVYDSLMKLVGSYETVYNIQCETDLFDKAIDTILSNGHIELVVTNHPFSEE